MEKDITPKLTMFTSNDGKNVVVLTCDEGWKPVIAMRDCLIETYGLELTLEYGLTDIIYSFDFGGHALNLRYISDEEMITLETYANDPALLRRLRQMAVDLIAKFTQRGR